jgi:pyruvate,orthophosphate dikinase
MTEKFVYTFATNDAQGDASMKNLLGGKGANLAEMARLGIPVPPGFTITTEVCTHFYKNGRKYPEGLRSEVQAALAFLEKHMAAKFGSSDNPLLLSVRSGARASMPGMMDTVLNLGLNDAAVEGVIRQTGDKRFAYDAYRRFVQMYGDVVMEVRPASETDRDPFDMAIEHLKERKGVKSDVDLGWEDLKQLVATFKAIVLDRTGKTFPDDPMEQLWGAVGAVFGSWMNERAIVYRELNNIPAEWGTAVNVQCMVFGNMGDGCATGVGFTRDSGTGERRANGEFLFNAQGEDVVAGIRTPLELTRADSQRRAADLGISEADRAVRFPSLEEAMPEVFNQLMAIYANLETHYKDMQDVEFTIQKNRLFMLQTRTGKRTGYAALRIAVDMADEGLIDAKEAVSRVSPAQLDQVLKPIFDTSDKKKALKEKRMLARGLPAGPGAAAGRVVFTGLDAEKKSKEWKQPVILVRHETSPEDIKGMRSALGILTARGGMTSHAALVGRQMGKVCVVGCAELEIDYDTRTLAVNGHVVKEGDWISLDGFTGQILEGRIKTVESEVLEAVAKGREPRDHTDIYYHYRKLMQWADEFKRLGVRANADEPEHARAAILNGAVGIGLCRTEHMFFSGERIKAVRQMILADTLEERQAALAKLLPMQRDDFKGIFREMKGYPVTVRTLDPPLHEFLPHEEHQIAELARDLGMTPDRVHQKVKSLSESNPMLGHRGCRLGIVYPEITAMQARAIIEAAVEVHLDGIKVAPEIMIPLVGHVNELEAQRKLVEETADKVFQERGVRIDYLVGTMIELPRAAVTADRIASVAQFFSFGTNDLTQTTFGLSRDDAGSFLGFYQEHGILPANPFETLDTDGVGALMRIAVEKGRSTRPEIKLGICGEHGGDPASVHFCHEIGLNYVSCSPPRVPVARLAAAQIALKGAGKK